MSVDLTQSRRTCNEYCRYWTRDERDNYVSDEFIYKRIPSGSFWCEEISPEQMRDNIIGGAFMLDTSRVTVRTPDDIYGLKSEDLVEFRGEQWIVVSVQKSKAKLSNTMYARDRFCSHYWYIELRK